MTSASLVEWSATIRDSNNLAQELTAKYRALVEKLLQEQYHRSLPTENLPANKLAQAVGDAVLKGGKRLRPILALVSCEAICESYLKAVPIALACELAHSSSLVQDDIFDDSPLRRNQPSIFSKYGTVKAVLVADYMIFDVFDVISTYRDLNVPRKKLGEIVHQISIAAKKTAQGELLDIALSRKDRVTEEEYVEMIGLKTGALFAAPPSLGTLIGGGNARQYKDMYEFGYYLGLSFQVVDDILDIIGSAALTGKPVFKDLENNASNIVLVHALSTADPYNRNLVRSMLWKKSIPMSDVSTVVSLLGRIGSIEYALKLADKFSSMARRKLDCLSDSPPKEILKKLATPLLSKEC